MNFLAPLVAVAATTLSSPLSKIELDMIALTPKQVETKLDSIILFTPTDKEGIPLSFEFDVDGNKKKIYFAAFSPSAINFLNDRVISQSKDKELKYKLRKIQGLRWKSMLKHWLCGRKRYFGEVLLKLLG